MTNLGPLSFNNSGNPTSNLHTYSVDPNNPVAMVHFPSTAPPSAGVQYGGGSLNQGVDLHYRDPQSNQLNLTLERQLTNTDSLRVSLVQMHSYRLNITEDINQLPASKVSYDASKLPFTNWGQIFSTFNHDKSNYKALEVELSHRMAHGVYFNANYTLAENKANNQGDIPGSFAGEVNYGFPIADRFNTNSVYGNFSGNRRNRFLLTGILQLPFGSGRQYFNHSEIGDRLFGGWDLTTITLLSSGPWLTPSISPSADQSNTSVAARGAFLRPDVVSTDFTKGRSRTNYFNLNAFAPTPDGVERFGNAGVGILEGPGTKTVSLGVAKSFKITESTRIRLESTFTNIFNHTNFAPPSTQIDNADFAILKSATTAENAGNRTGQVALCFDF